MSASKISFETVRTCEVEVQYLRGVDHGRAGFWITTTCHQEKLSSLSFCDTDNIPTNDAQIASNVLCYSDADHEGITGKGGKVRMLRQREQFNAQGFPPDYIIDRTADFRRITNVRAQQMVGNSVSPPPLVAYIRAQFDHDQQPARLAA